MSTKKRTKVIRCLPCRIKGHLRSENRSVDHQRSEFCRCQNVVEEVAGDLKRLTIFSAEEGDFGAATESCDKDNAGNFNSTAKGNHEDVNYEPQVIFPVSKTTNKSKEVVKKRLISENKVKSEGVPLRDRKKSGKETTERFTVFSAIRENNKMPRASALNSSRERIEEPRTRINSIPFRHDDDASKKELVSPERLKKIYEVASSLIQNPHPLFDDEWEAHYFGRRENW